MAAGLRWVFMRWVDEGDYWLDMAKTQIKPGQTTASRLFE